MPIVANFDIDLLGDKQNIGSASTRTLPAMAGLSKSVEASTTMIGGAVGTLLGGPLGTGIGAAIGTMVGRATSAVASVFDSARERLSGIVGDGTEDAKGVAASYGSAWEEITASLSESWERVADAAKPVLSMIGDGFHAIAEQVIRLLKPVLNWLTSAFEGVAFTVKAVFDVIAEAIKPAWDWLVKLVDKWVEASEKWPDGGEIAIKALREIAVAGAYVYDAIKALAGTAAIAAGKIIKTLSQKFINRLSNAGYFWGALTEGLPNWLGGKEAERQSAILARLNFDSVRAANALARKGRAMIEEFGQSAARVGGFFDETLDRYKKRDRSKKPVDEGMSKLQGGAIERGSLEAFKIIAAEGDKHYTAATEKLKLFQEIRREFPGYLAVI